MILYNTLMGVAAGLALILVPLLARKLYLKRTIAAEGWSLSFFVTGALLTFLGGLMTVTWPLTVNPPINIAFAEPTLMLGLLLLAAAFFLWRNRETVEAIGSGNAKAAAEAHDRLQKVLMPVSWVVFGLGLTLVACTFAIFRFTLVGSAPAEEPISGLLHDYPAVENAFFGIIYGLSALGSVLAPFAIRNLGGTLAKVAFACLISAGVIFLLFSVMNYYTHIGLLVNLEKGTDFRF